MTLVKFFADFLRPYMNLPEFISCVMKALEELEHPVTWKLKANPKDKKADKVWGEIDKTNPAKFEAYGVDCDK